MNKRLSVVEWTGKIETFEQSVNNACQLIEKTSGTVLNIDIRQERAVMRDHGSAVGEVISYRAFIIYAQA